MDDKYIEKLKLEINNLMQYRNIYLNFLALLFSGVLGLVLTEFSILKICLVIIGIFIIYFLSIMIYLIDVEIDNKIKDVEK